MTAYDRKSRGYRVGHIAGFHAGIRQAAAEAMIENERRLALASIRIPAMASEIRDAILALIDNSIAEPTYEQGVTAGFDEAIYEVKRGEIDPQTYDRKSTLHDIIRGRVKPLVWEDNGQDEIWASGYSICSDRPDEYIWFPPYGDGVVETTETAAQAAANAHHVASIMASLDAEGV